MLKEVGASGQISLGKKYAGQLFEVQTAPDGTITLMPVKVVPAPLLAREEPARYASATPTGSASLDPADWAQQHTEQIAQYNTWAAERQPYSQRVRHWREAKK